MQPSSFQHEVVEITKQHNYSIITTSPWFGKTTALCFVAAYWAPYCNVGIVAKETIPMKEILSKLVSKELMSKINFLDEHSIRGVSCDFILIDDLDDVNMDFTQYVIAPMINKKGAKWLAVRTETQQVPLLVSQWMKYAYTKTFLRSLTI